jgi:hypothetical protein
MMPCDAGRPSARTRKANGLCRLQIDNQFKSNGLPDRHVTGLFPFENLARAIN